MLPATALAVSEHADYNGWTALTNISNNTLSSGSYYLETDVTYTGTGTVTLCLNAMCWT